MTNTETRYFEGGWEQRRESTPVRYNGKCKGCGKFQSRLVVASLSTKNAGRIVESVETETGEKLVRGSAWFPLLSCECGHRVPVKAVKGIVRKEIECNGKCMASHGHVCECSCGGKNHGASHG